METLQQAPDKATVSAAERVGSTLAAAATVGYSERDVVNVRRSLRRAGKRVTNRQIRAALNLAAWSA